jgi:asparagine synthase (glutamine-hydrolysing)
VPFLDHTFVEFAMAIPDRLKIHGATQKYVLKRAVEDLLPAEIIHRRKMGFPTPLRQWLMDPKTGPLMKSLQARDGLLAEYVRPAQLQELIDRHRRGLVDATDRLWRLLNLQIWGDVFLTGKRGRWENLVSRPQPVSVPL